MQLYWSYKVIEEKKNGGDKLKILYPWKRDVLDV
jgi:hypothetical protein